MKLLALDPGSRRAGYAILTGLEPGDLIEAGLIKPSSQDAEPIERIDEMLGLLDQIAADACPDCSVIEIPNGKIHRRLAGVGAGQSVYGMAAGAMWAALREWLPGRWVAVDQNAWTKGVGKKQRQAQCAAIYPTYAGAMSRDAGLDACDAIMLGRWRLALLQIARAAEMVERSRKRE